MIGFGIVMISIVVKSNYAKTKTKKALVKYRMTGPISLPPSGLLPLNCTIFLFVAELSLRLRPQLSLGGGFRYGGRSVTWGRHPKRVRPQNAKVRSGTWRRWGRGKRENLGKGDHETVWRVWGLLGSELHEIVTSFGHIHLLSTLLLRYCTVLFIAIMTQDTETRPLNILIVGAGNFISPVVLIVRKC